MSENVDQDLRELEVAAEEIRRAPWKYPWWAREEVARNIAAIEEKRQRHHKKKNPRSRRSGDFEAEAGES